MIASAKLDQLAAALSAAQGEFESVSKGANNPFFKSKYASLPDVVKAAAPVLAKHGLSVMQFPGWLDQGDRDTLTTIVLHESGQHIGDTMLLKLPKNDAQGQGSAMTYARRYSYMAALGLVADEDDDGNAASRPASRPAAPPEPPPVGPNVEAASQDLRDAFSMYRAWWESLADSEKNLFGPPMMPAEFTRQARQARDTSTEADVSPLIELSAKVEGMIQRG